MIAVALYPGLTNTPMLQKSIGRDAAEVYQTPEEWPAPGREVHNLKIDEGNCCRLRLHRRHKKGVLMTNETHVQTYPIPESDCPYSSALHFK